MVICNICRWSGEAFLPLYYDYYVHDNVICPSCKSHQRHRAIAYYLDKANILGPTGMALEIGNGETRSFKTHFERKNWTYFSVEPNPIHGGTTGDIANLTRHHQYDLVICVHVLEHVENDLKSIAELSRVCKNSGLAVIQVPFADDRFNTIKRDVPPVCDAGVKYYSDHKREYGLDILERLGSYWHKVVEIHPLLFVSEGEAVQHGFEKDYGTFFICHNGFMHSYPGRLERNLLLLKRRSMIEKKSFEIFQRRNLYSSNDDNQLDDWLQAEREVTSLPDEVIRNLKAFDS